MNSTLQVQPRPRGRRSSAFSLAIAVFLCGLLVGFRWFCSQPTITGLQGLGQLFRQGAFFLLVCAATMWLAPAAVILAIVALYRVRNAPPANRGIVRALAWSGIALTLLEIAGLVIPAALFYRRITYVSPAQQARYAEYAPGVAAGAWASACENYARSHDGLLPPDLQTLYATAKPPGTLPGQPSDYLYYGSGLHYSTATPHMLILARNVEIAPGRRIVGLAAEPRPAGLAVDSTVFIELQNDVNRMRQDHGLPAISASAAPTTAPR